MARGRIALCIAYKAMNYVHSTGTEHGKCALGLPLLMIATWLTALGSAAGDGTGAWVEHRIGPFRVFAEFSLSETGTLIEDLRRLPDDLSRTLQLPPCEEEIEVYLFGNKSDYDRYVAASMPDAPRQRRALFVQRPGSNRVYAYRNRHLECDVRHECTHALLHASLPVVPLWLDEGLATYFEVEPAERFAGNPARRGVLWDMRLGRMASLASLEKLASVEAFASEDYRAGWAWIHFMIHGPAEATAELVAFLADIRGRQPPGSLRARLHRRLPDIDRQFKEHLRGQR